MLKKYILSDLYRIHPKDKYTFTDILRHMSNPGFCYLVFFRMCSLSSNKLIRLFSKFVIRHLRYKFGFQIVPSTKIGLGFYIGHFGHIIINPKVQIGSNCNISPGVTIGKIHGGNKEGAPIIGNNVWIGTNAVIVGGVVIQDDVLIAPGAYVNFNVPSNSIVLGNPGKIIPKENPCYNIINNKVE